MWNDMWFGEDVGMGSFGAASSILGMDEVR